MDALSILSVLAGTDHVGLGAELVDGLQDVAAALLPAAELLVGR